jgi:hypothetical protein
MEHMTYKASWSLFLWLFEAGCQKGLFWILAMGKPAFFELLAITGYKFVMLCPVVITDLLFGYYPSYISVFLFGAVFALFFYNTMARFMQSNTLAAHMKEVSLNKKTFLFGNSLVQIALILLLSFY